VLTVVFLVLLTDVSMHGTVSVMMLFAHLLCQFLQRVRMARHADRCTSYRTFLERKSLSGYSQRITPAGALK